MGQSAEWRRWTRSYQRLREGTFSTAPAPPPLKKRRVCKFPRTPREYFMTPISKTRSKPQTFHGTVHVSVSNKRNNERYKEKKEPFSYEREGWVALIIWIVVPIRGFLIPWKNNFNCFAPFTKEQTFWWGRWRPPRRGGDGAGTSWPPRATSCPFISPQRQKWEDQCRQHDASTLLTGI